MDYQLRELTHGVTIHVILLENYVLFILVFYIVIYLIIPVVIVVLKCIVLISTVLFKLFLLYPEKGLIIENKICHCHLVHFKI